MATKYECDRCGSQFSENKQIKRISYSESQQYRSYEDEDKSKDLCEMCNKQLIEWLKPLPKAVFSKTIPQESNNF